MLQQTEAHRALSSALSSQARGRASYLQRPDLPRVGRTDAERNCVSNIRPDGFPLAAAAEISSGSWSSRSGALSGVGLQDERGTIAAARPPPLPGPE